MKQKIASKFNPFLLSRGASEKTWLHITEDNHHSCYRILIRAFKTEQYTWIFVSNGPKLTKYCGPLQSFRFDLADCKDISRDRNCSSEYRNDCKAKFRCTLMVILKRVTVLQETVGNM